METIDQPQAKQLAKKLTHYMTKAIADYAMLAPADRLLVCLSGGKDSYSMVDLLWRLHNSSAYDFDMHVYTLDQTQPGWDDHARLAGATSYTIHNRKEKHVQGC